MKSDQPFGKTLTRVMEDQEVSTRELWRRTLRKYNWGSHYTIAVLRRGELRPTMHAMEKIASVLGIPPDTFAEYRLMIARNQLDPDVVGLKAALKRLSEIE